MSYTIPRRERKSSKHFSFRLTHGDFEQLREIANDLDMPMSDLVRASLEQALRIRLSS